MHAYHIGTILAWHARSMPICRPSNKHANPTLARYLLGMQDLCQDHTGTILAWHAKSMPHCLGMLIAWHASIVPVWGWHAYC